MKKLVLKTALITLSAIIGLSAIFYGVMALCFPLTVAGFFESVGLNDVAVAYYKINYDKTDNIVDLADVCIKVDQIKDGKRAEGYLTELVERGDFSAYCEAVDKNNNNPLKSRDFFYGKLVVATYFVNGIDEAITKAELAVLSGYSEYSPFRILLNEGQINKDDELIKIRDSITAIKENLQGEQRTFAEGDVAYIEELLSE